MKMYVWTDHHSFMVAAYAMCVDAARQAALSDIGPSDGSCPNRNKVLEWIRDVNPTIWRDTVNVDFAITEWKTDKDPEITTYS